MELDDDGSNEDQRAQKKMPRWTLEADFDANLFVNQEDANNPWTSNKTTDSKSASAAKGSTDPVTTLGGLVQRRRDRNWNTVQVVCTTMPSNTDNRHMESILANPTLCMDLSSKVNMSRTLLGWSGIAVYIHGPHNQIFPEYIALFNTITNGFIFV